MRCPISLFSINVCPVNQDMVMWAAWLIEASEKSPISSCPCSDWPRWWEGGCSTASLSLSLWLWQQLFRHWPAPGFDSWALITESGLGAWSIEKPGSCQSYKRGSPAHTSLELTIIQRKAGDAQMRSGQDWFCLVLPGMVVAAAGTIWNNL